MDSVLVGVADSVGEVSNPPCCCSAEAAAHDQVPLEAFAVIDEFLATHGGDRERLIPLLHRVQEKIGYLPYPVQKYIATALGMSPIQVYEVVSFYHLFTTTPRGRYQLKVCLGTACFVRGSQQLLNTLSETLDLPVGQISDDHLFNLDQVRCIGACGLAPAITVNNEVHGNLSPNDVRKLARKLRAQAKREAAADNEEVSA